MTITQILVVAIGGLAVLLSAQLLRTTVTQRRQAADSEFAFRQVGTFGSRGSSGAHAMSLPSTGSSGRTLLIMFLLVATGATGLVGKLAWDETHPDIRSAYGRAYERCVQQGVSRWNVDDVERCIYRGPGS
jgi:hypothetical protein